MSKRMKIIALSAFGVGFLLLMVVGIFIIGSYSGQKNSYQVKVKTQKSAVKQSDVYQILSMGDSLANGTGDVSGLGFAKDYANLLKNQDKISANVTNLAVNGDTSDGLLAIVQNEKTADIIKQADIIFLSIGGNEVDKFVNYRSLGSSEDYDTVEKKYEANVTNTLSIIRSLNKDCKIGFLGLYNPYGKYLSDASKLQLFDWNMKTQKLLLQQDKVFYIPTYDLFTYHEDSYLTIDHFHPNVDGYQAIANRIYEILKKTDFSKSVQ